MRPPVDAGQLDQTGQQGVVMHQMGRNAVRHVRRRGDFVLVGRLHSRSSGSSMGLSASRRRLRARLRWSSFAMASGGRSVTRNVPLASKASIKSSRTRMKSASRADSSALFGAGFCFTTVVYLSNEPCEADAQRAVGAMLGD